MDVPQGQTLPRLGGAAFFADPYAAYARYREAGGLARDEATGAWLVSRHADVDALLRHAPASKRSHAAAPNRFERSVLFQDPPEHTRTRAVLNRVFSGRAIQAAEANMLAAADALIDRIAGRGTGDFIADFALPFPLTVICEMLGVPPADRALLRAWSSGFIVEETDDPASRARAQTEAVAGLGNYFSDLLARRRRDPGSDILSEMIRPHAGEPRLTDSELAGNCILLMVAGHETTVNLLGNGLLLLLRRPEDLARLRGDPSLWPGAIAEMLRFEAPVQRSTFRLTTSPIELGGEMLPAGAQVTALIGAANRDPAVFADPDRFDITRRPNQHLSFGAGPHHCLGAALGRLEARIGFTRLLERLPRLRLAGGAKPGLFGRPAGSPTAPTPPAWRANAVIRGLRRLDVAW